jgi:SAM-dependent methyltransferase
MTSEPAKVTPAELYEQIFVPAMFGPWAQRVVRAAAPKPDQSVLDLACGTGIVARTVAPLVGRAGRVVGLDLRPAMLAVARSSPPPDGAQIEWVEGDATRLDLPDDSFDLVICQAGLQFFSDRDRALRETRRVLRPGGRLAVLVWQSLERQALFHAFAVVESRHLASLGVDEEEFNTPFSMGNPDLLRTLLAEAGFSGGDVTQEELDVRFGDPDRFIHNMEYAYSAVIPEFAQDPSRFEAFVDAVTADTRDVVAAFRVGDEIVFPVHANITTAVKAP